jgi:hypothetical protein
VTDAEKIELIDTALRKLYEFLASDANNGVVSISREGFSATYNRSQAIEQIKFLESEREKLQPKRTLLRTIQL